MWSTAYTGHKSIFLDAYQRVAIHFTYKELTDNISKATALVEKGFLHLSIFTDSTLTVEDVSNFAKIINQIRTTVTAHGSKVSEHLIVSLRIALSSDMNEKIQVIANSDIPCVLLIMYEENRVAYANNVNNCVAFLSSFKSSLNIGLEFENTVTQRDIDWILGKLTQKSIKVVSLGKVNLPNIQLRKLELVHKYGFNTMTTIDAGELRKIIDAEYMKEFSAKNYGEISNETFFCKCLLQLGYIPVVCVGEKDLSYVNDHFARCIHPFVYRRLFVSEVKVISINVSVADLEVLKNHSERVESQADEEWRFFATDRLPDRQLTAVANCGP